MLKLKGGLLAAAIMLMALFCTTDVQAYIHQTVYDGVCLETTDISGMNEAEIRSAAEALIAEKGLSQITFHMNGNSYTTTAGALGYSWTNEDVVQEALQYGKRGNVVSRYKQKKDLEQTSVALLLEGTVNDGLVQTMLETNCVQFNQEPKEHAVEVQGGDIVQVPGVIGVSLDVAASVAEIHQFMTEEWRGGPADIDLIVTTTEPGGDAEMLAKITDRLGKGSTDYSSSSTSRKANIKNAVSKIDGTILYPGEQFSVINAITPFTEENGYEEAGSYNQGEVVDSLGGGVCQVATTLYLALIRSELQIDRRSAHSMPVSYVKPAFDAAVAEGSKDLKFTNNTDAPIYIYGVADGDMVAFSIFGMDTRDPDREVEFKSVPVESTDPKVKQAAELWKYVTVDGKTTKERVNTSTYYKNNTEVANEEAAQKVIALIDAIGEVTLGKANAIANADSAFQALTQEQKYLVTNDYKLSEAKNKLSQLQAEAAQQEQQEQTTDPSTTEGQPEV